VSEKEIKRKNNYLHYLLVTRVTKEFTIEIPTILTFLIIRLDEDLTSAPYHNTIMAMIKPWSFIENIILL
jgi:hypothetical protein